MSKPSSCYFCKHKFDKPMDIIRYKDRYFCSEECLGEYLVKQIEDEIDVEWFDTEENMRICAEEEKRNDAL